MFSKTPRAGGARPSPGARVGDGPTPIRGEKLQLRSFERKEEDATARTPVGASTTDDAEATRSLLILSSQTKGDDNTNGGGSSLTPASASGAPPGEQPKPTNGTNGAAGASATTTLSANSGPNGVMTQQDSQPDAWFGGQALEYAAGVALRTNVLRPILEKPGEEEELSFAMRTQAPRLLGEYSSGKVILFKDTSGVIQEASILRTSHKDSTLLASWWKDDKVLSYTSELWSDWWVRRCHCLDPGCEMYKFVEKSGNALGVVYYERNIVDRHLLETGERTRTTLVRGIRLAPSINPEVMKRSSLSDTDKAPEVPCKGIASLLLCHVLFASIRYGSQCVGVNCPKNEVAERFYESFMGKFIARNEDDGRRYYRMNSSSRWATLQQAFRRQILLWVQKESEDQTSSMTAQEGGASVPNSPAQKDDSADVKQSGEAGDKESQGVDGEAEPDTKRRRYEQKPEENGDKAANGKEEEENKSSEDEMEDV